MTDKLAESLGRDIVRLEQRVDELETQLEELDRLRERVDELDARTDIMQLVDESDEMGAEQRRLAVLTHMHRKIQRSDSEMCLLTVDDVRECLHYPDLHRTTFYSDMQDIAAAVDSDVCRYRGRGDGRIDAAYVVLDLRDGELPDGIRQEVIQQ